MQQDFSQKNFYVEIKGSVFLCLETNKAENP